MITDLPVLAGRVSKKMDFYARSIHSPRVQKASGVVEKQVLKDLKHEGVSVTSPRELALQDTDVLFDTVKRASAHLPDIADFKFSFDKRCASSHRINVSNQQLLQYPDIYLWGLQDQLIDLIETYFRQPIAYLGCGLGLEVPDRDQTGIRLWHRDGEDYKVVKVILYLNEVDDFGGPFEYIPRKISPTYRPFRQNNNFIQDKDMARVIPQRQWKRCNGQQGTLIIADTTSVFHHASTPQNQRLTLTFGYVSAKPKNLEMTKAFNKHFDEAAVFYKSMMTLRQRQVAIDWRISS